MGLSTPASDTSLPAAGGPVPVGALVWRDVEARGSSLWRDAWRRLIRNKLAVAGGVTVVALCLVAVFADFIAPHPYTKADFGRIYEFPSRDFPLGTDQLGRDVLSRVITGARDILIITPLATLLGTVLGTALGLAMGYFGGWFDSVVSRIVEAILALPFVIIAFVVFLIVSLIRTTRDLDFLVRVLVGLRELGFMPSIDARNTLDRLDLAMADFESAIKLDPTEARGRPAIDDVVIDGHRQIEYDADLVLIRPAAAPHLPVPDPGP